MAYQRHGSGRLPGAGWCGRTAAAPARVPSGLAGHEGLVTRGVEVGPTRAAGAARSARQRREVGDTTGVEGAGAREFPGLAPGAADPAGHEHLRVAGTVAVGPGGAAVARRRARQRGDRGDGDLVQRGDPRDLFRLAPGTAHPVDHERLLVTGTGVVEPAGAAVAHRRTGHRNDRGVVAGVERAAAGDLLDRAPGAVDLIDHEGVQGVSGRGVVPAGAAVARRRARQRCDTGHGAVVVGRGSGEALGLAPGAAGLADHERLVADGDAAGVVPAARAAVAVRGTGHRVDPGVAALVQGAGAGNLLGLAPDAAGLADHERLLGGAAAVGPVVPAEAAVTRRRARHRADLGAVAGVERGETGDLRCLAPDAIGLTGNEHFLDQRGGAGIVITTRDAVARRGTRHRLDAGVAAGVERGQAGHLLRLAPGAAHLADDESFVVGVGVLVVATRDAVTSRGARHRKDGGVTEGVERGGTGYLLRLPPDGGRANGRR